MRERRMRMHWRHEHLSLRVALAAATRHSSDEVHAEHAAPRSQRTGTTAGEGEVFELRVAPRGQNTPHPEKRLEPLEEVSEAQAGIRRLTGVGYELVLDPVVPQMAEQLVEVFDNPVLGDWRSLPLGGLQGSRQDKVLLCMRCQRLLWSTSHPRLPCFFFASASDGSLLHPRQQCLFKRPRQCWSSVTPAPLVFPSPAPVAEYFSPAPACVSAS